MLAKIKQYQTLAYKELTRLKDLRTVGMLVFVAIVLLVSWSGVKAINTNYLLQKQISQLGQQNAVQQLANDNLKLQNDYYNTPQYLELSARHDFGLAAPGETEWIVPENVAIAHTVELPQDKIAAAAATVPKQSAIERHFQAWMDFFMHRPKN